jgi:hypothetical protein
MSWFDDLFLNELPLFEDSVSSQIRAGPEAYRRELIEAKPLTKIVSQKDTEVQRSGRLQRRNRRAVA